MLVIRLMRTLMAVFGILVLIGLVAKMFPWVTAMQTVLKMLLILLL